MTTHQKPPKFAIGQAVYVMPVVNATYVIVDRYWDETLKPEPGWRYKFQTEPWFPENLLMNQEELEKYLKQQKYLKQVQPEAFYDDDE